MFSDSSESRKAQAGEQIKLHRTWSATDAHMTPARMKA
jgi:hypothetical protein